MTKRDLSLGFRVSDEFIAGHPEVDTSAVEAVINVMAVAELMFSRRESLLAPFGLSKGGHNILNVLAGADEPLTPTQLGERVLVRPATVTGLVDTLVRIGHVERWPDPQNRRRVLVSITAAGRDVVANANEDAFADNESIMACLTETERERLIRILGKLQGQLRDSTS